MQATAALHVALPSMYRCADYNLDRSWGTTNQGERPRYWSIGITVNFMVSINLILLSTEFIYFFFGRTVMSTTAIMSGG
jgi:hypothetical protein